MIITFGSINLDITFPLDHIPQAGETVLGKTFLMSSGGKGANQALAASRAGTNTTMVGQVGKDGFADEALKLLRADQVNLDHIVISDLPTGCASIWVDRGGENSIAVASGANLSVLETQVPDALLTGTNWLLIQMETPAEENWKLIRRAKKAGSHIILNAAPASFVPLDILNLIDILIVNEGEARIISGHLDMNEENITRLPRRFSEKFGLQCILTMGGAGSLYFGPEGGWSTPALPIAAVDTTAAGDTFVGFFGACISQGKTIEESLRLASVAAGQCCLTSGSQTSIPTIELVLENLNSLPPSTALTIG